jgi:hypothetical protein
MFSIFANELVKIDSRSMEKIDIREIPRKKWIQKNPTFECKNPSFD